MTTMTNDNMKELTHTLEIIQNKLKACQQEKRLKLNKMTTKRALLGESFEVLQNSLGSSLTQDLRQKPSYHNHSLIMNVDQHMTPIIGEHFDNEATEGPLTDKLKLIHCKGWIKDNTRVWIQAQALCLSNDVNSAHLSSIPNTFTETVYSNSVTEFTDSAVVEFYMTFDVLPDMLNELSNLKVACNIDNRYISAMCGVEWVHGCEDLTWKDQFLLLLSIPAATTDVIQAYFPCHLQIRDPRDNGAMTDLLESMISLNDRIFVSKDQLYMLDLGGDDDMIKLYGVNTMVVARIASRFTHLSTKEKGTTTTSKRELIKSLGKQCVTLEHNNQLNQARLHTALLLSDMTEQQ